MATHRVLVVDDEPSIRFVLEKALGKAGFEVDTADSAEAARERLASSRYAVALLDVRPREAVARELRLHP